MLSQEERLWLEREATRLFNITPKRARVLQLMLTAEPGFSYKAIGRAVEMSAEGVSLAAEHFTNAGLVTLSRRDVAEAYLPWSATPGPHLQALLDALVTRERAAAS